MLPIQKGYFTFKQFAVKQEQTTLKVCTESCLFGALIDIGAAKSVLDIGTGTGLLPLMLAQKFPDAHFSGLEIDPLATIEAEYNFQNSPWSNRLSAVNANVLEFTPSELFEDVICNPPFFPDHLLGPDPKKNAALHTTSLNFTDLAHSVNRLTANNGRFWCLLPPYQMEQLVQEMAVLGWFIHQNIQVHNVAHKPVFRVIAQFKKNKMSLPIASKTILIKENNNTYSPEFTLLLTPFYLHI